jgi:hypothetical protein
MLAFKDSSRLYVHRYARQLHACPGPGVTAQERNAISEANLSVGRKSQHHIDDCCAHGVGKGGFRGLLHTKSEVDGPGVHSLNST